MRKLLLDLTCCVFVCFNIIAQKPIKPNSVEIHNAIKRLNFLGSVLYVAAHPDDENTELISYLTNHLNARTAYLSLTRGDGGQNLIGPEIREQLGVIRTQELLKARSVDGGEQLFSRANDFGFSKHPDETLSIWNKEEVLSDVVWNIRQFKPDVIINRFDHRTPGTTHGHHTASALLSLEAFDLTANSKSYPNQLEKTNTWQPKRLLFNTSSWFYGGKEKFDQIDKSNFLNFETGKYYSHLGLSNTEIAALSRSQHKCQGFGTTGKRGSKTEYLEVIKGSNPKDKQDLFEGIDTSWNRVKGGAEIGSILKEVEDNFDFTNPALSLPKLLKAYELIQGLKNEHWKTLKTEEIKEIISSCTGLYIEAVAANPFATRNEKIAVKIEAINRSNFPVELNSITLKGLNAQKDLNVELKNNINFQKEIEGQIAIDEEYTTPYWLNNKASLGMYSVTNQQLIGLPETPREYIAQFSLKIRNTVINIDKAIIYKKNDPVKAEIYQPFEVVPKVSARLKDDVIIFSGNQPKDVIVNIKAFQDNLEGVLKLDIPESWKIEPRESNFKLSKKGEEQAFNFILTPPNSQSEGEVIPSIIVDKEVFKDEVININYDHIPTQTLILPAKAKVVKIDIEKKGDLIGYIEGAGDIVPESLEQIGYKVELIKPETISENSLKRYDAVVVGIRAYNIIETLVHKQATLLDYVNNGGNLVIQYNTNHRLKVTENLGPYPLELSRDRVTDENAEVRILDKNHPVLNYPNKITSKDFEGWVQERGLYFPNKWDESYTPIFSINDSGETEKKGSLLVAKYGKGNYIYTGLSFFREFPVGVPGAFRLFANLLSANN